MRKRLCVLAGVLALGASIASAQLTLQNTARVPPSPTATTTGTGTAHQIDPGAQIGSGCVLRAAGAANAAYLPTGIALDVTTSGNSVGPARNNGLTIQFWLKPGTATGTFMYHWGDSAWVGTNGAFRCFQNGAAGVGNLILRGPLTQVATIGTPLTASQNAQGWIHFACVVDNTAGTLAWYVNGTLNASGASTPLPPTATSGPNFTCLGYNGSSSAGHSDRYDDFRIYNWARTAADIAADYQTVAAGTGPSGSDNVPDEGYFECDASQNAHNGTIALFGEAQDSTVRLFSDADTIEWAASSPASGPFTGTALMNVTVGVGGLNPRTTAYQTSPALPGGPFVTSIVPTLTMGHCVSTPGRSSIAFPDGLAIGGVTSFCPGSGAIPGAYVYGAGQTPPSPLRSFSLPPGIPWVDGDRIDVEWVSFPDTTYGPFNVASTNRATFMYVKPTKQGAACHVEVRGVDVIQVTGFFEVHNTGTVPITKVELDIGPVSKSWIPTGALNSGGTLATGDSYRWNTELFCELHNPPPAAPTTRYTLTGANLAFDFLSASGGFQGPTNHFVWDCAATAGAGNTYIGAVAKVTFADMTVLTGPLVADPSDPQAAQVDL